MLEQARAILNADVVGYSRLMAEDEARTIRTLGAYRDEIRFFFYQPMKETPRMSPPNLQLLSEFECFEIWNFVGK